MRIGFEVCAGSDLVVFEISDGGGQDRRCGCVGLGWVGFCDLEGGRMREWRQVRFIEVWGC
jgi:hypothetical protein